ncbi:MAG: hypothetical protein AAF581_04230 [Planctomycetota bacterium]
MESLASVGPSPTIPVLPAPLTQNEQRDSSQAQPTTQQRSVELLPDRVDPSDSSHVSQHTRNQDEPAAGNLGTKGALADTRKDSIDLSAAGGTPAKNHGVTYKVRPDLSIKFQGQVVDRANNETLKSIPTDARVEVAERYQQYIGSNLDVRA